MIKPTDLYLWTQIQSMYLWTQDFQHSVGQRNEELHRMFPEDEDFLKRSMWLSFLIQREKEVNLFESDEESEDEPEPKKKGMSNSVLKGKSADASDDSPVPTLEPLLEHDNPTPLERRSCGAVVTVPWRRW